MVKSNGYISFVSKRTLSDVVYCSSIHSGIFLSLLLLSLLFLPGMCISVCVCRFSLCRLLWPTLSPIRIVCVSRIDSSSASRISFALSLSLSVCVTLIHRHMACLCFALCTNRYFCVYV